jgi:hypothetical protein
MNADTELAEIERELEELRFKAPFPTFERAAAHNDRIAELMRRKQELPRRPEPVTGERAGSVVVGIDRLLGSIPARHYEPVVESNHHSSSLGDGLHPWMPRD